LANLLLSVMGTSAEFKRTLLRDRQHFPLALGERLLTRSRRTVRPAPAVAAQNRHARVVESAPALYWVCLKAAA
jgi:hypothetical protein